MNEISRLQAETGHRLREALDAAGKADKLLPPVPTPAFTSQTESQGFAHVDTADGSSRAPDPSLLAATRV